MLGKLLKHEFKATSRLMLPLYLICIAVTILNKLVSVFEFFDYPETVFYLMNSFKTLTVALYIFVLLSIMVATLIICIIRFYKNMLGSQGYLTFTLPVKTYEHILSKGITSVIWFLISSVVVIISIFITIVDKDVIAELSKFSYHNLDHAVYYSIGIHLIPFLILVLLLFIVYFSGIVVIMYSSLSIGNLFNKNKILGSFLGYLIIKIINSAISSILILPLMIFMESHIDSSFEFTLPYLIFMIVYNALITVLYFFVANYILSKKLNLQ